MDENLIKLKHLRQAATEANGRISEVAETAAEAIEEVAAAKQDKLSGLPGQVVGFDSDGNAIPQEAQNGIVEWENINGRPDLSNISRLKTILVIIDQTAWNTNKRATLNSSVIVADETEQLIVPIPAKSSELAYYANNITCVKQDEGSLTFECATIPEEDVSINIFVLESSGFESEAVFGDFEWWSPNMSSENTPSPYVVTASKWESSGSIGGQPYMAFDGVPTNTGWFAVNSSVDLPPLWIAFDFGLKQAIKGISIRGARSYGLFQPTTFDLEGSNNGYDWIIIQHFDDVPKSLDETKLELNKPVKYRYYRLNNCDALEYADRPHAIIGEIRFYKEVTG